MNSLGLQTLRNVANVLAESKDPYIFGTEEYDKKIENVIDELMAIKSTLRKNGKNVRRYHRKEATSLQSAVNALKYLRKKSERKMTKLMS